MGADGRDKRLPLSRLGAIVYMKNSLSVMNKNLAGGAAEGLRRMAEQRRGWESGMVGLKLKPGSCERRVAGVLGCRGKKHVEKLRNMECERKESMGARRRVMVKKHLAAEERLRVIKGLASESRERRAEELGKE